MPPRHAPTSTLVIVAALVGIVAIAIAAVLLVAPGAESNARIAAVFALVGTVVPILAGVLRSDQTRNQTNGSLDDRIESAVFRAQNVRRREVDGERDAVRAPLTPASAGAAGGPADPLQLE